MLKNYLITALRNVRRQKGYAFINVFGLSVGLACSFFILIWVTHELSFDRFHEHGDRLYRVMRHGYLQENIYTWESVPKPLADVLAADYPEVEDAILKTGTQNMLIRRQEDAFRRKGFHVSRCSSIASSPFRSTCLVMNGSKIGATPDCASTCD